MVDFDVDIYLTGSNSHLLSSELATFLVGRYVEFQIQTLSFKECLQFNSSLRKSKKSLAEKFEYFLRIGGFPNTVYNLAKLAQKKLIS